MFCQMHSNIEADLDLTVDPYVKKLLDLNGARSFSQNISAV